MSDWAELPARELLHAAGGHYAEFEVGVFAIDGAGKVHTAFTESLPIASRLWMLQAIDMGLVLDSDDPLPLLTDDANAALKLPVERLNPACSTALAQWPENLVQTMVCALSEAGEVSFATSDTLDFRGITLFTAVARHRLLAALDKG